MSALCCASDITLDEFKSLCGKMDASDPTATTVEQFLGGTATWRTDLYATCGTVMTHAESIELFRELGTKFTPELKEPNVAMPFGGDYTQQDYAQQLIDEYKAAGIPPQHVFPQPFDLDDVLYWIDHTPAYGRQAVYLDDRVDAGPDGIQAAIDDMDDLAARGVNIIAPRMWALIDSGTGGDIVPSAYAHAARDAASTSSPGPSSAPAPSSPAEATIINPSPTSRATTATRSRCSTCSRRTSACSACSPTGPRRSRTTPIAWGYERLYRGGTR